MDRDQIAGACVHYTKPNHSVLRVTAAPAYLSLENACCTSMKVIVDGAEVIDVDRIEIMLSGDSEQESLLEALEFAVAVLKGYVTQ